MKKILTLPNGTTILKYEAGEETITRVHSPKGKTQSMDFSYKVDSYFRVGDMRTHCFFIAKREAERIDGNA